jgi:GTP-sensing pleiotropic transcriptional regulator CodY
MMEEIIGLDGKPLNFFQRMKLLDDTNQALKHQRSVNKEEVAKYVASSRAKATHKRLGIQNARVDALGNVFWHKNKKSKKESMIRAKNVPKEFLESAYDAGEY